MSKGSDIVASDQGAKPTVHISKTDARIAQQQDRGQKSMSTVKTEWAKESEKLDQLSEKKRQIKEKDQITISDLLELWKQIPSKEESLGPVGQIAPR